MERERQLTIDTIEDLNRLYGVTTKSRLVSLVDLASDPTAVQEITVKLGVYAIYLKYPKGNGTVNDETKAGTITVFAPESKIKVGARSYVPEKELIALCFSPTLIKGSTFGRHFTEYTFFQYNREETLTLGNKELDIMTAIFRRIQAELQNEEDRNTLHILTDQVKLSLDYCLRFYDRQFANRHNQNYQIAQQFLQNINMYFNNGTAKQLGVPTISYFANLAHTSPGYFSDIIKKETGVNIKKYLQYKIIEAAKQMLSATNKPINEISEWLGFKYPQHFTRLFKHESGMSPRDYRKQRK